MSMKELGTMSIADEHTGPVADLVTRRMFRGIVIVLLTLAALALALHARWVSEHPPLSWASLTTFHFDSYEIGVAIQELVVPIALIYLFSGTSLFRRVIAGERTPRNLLKWFGVLAVIQGLALGYELGLFIVTDDQATLGLLGVVVGGLIGGWRVGLGLGLLTMFIRGTQDLFFYPDELVDIYRTAGLSGFLDSELWIDIFFWHYYINMEAVSAVWAGIVAGLSGSLLGKYRYAPGAALGLGLGVELVAGYIVAIYWWSPEDMIAYLLPITLVSGLAMAVIALIVRNVQAESDRRKAAAAELALARAELRALRAQINPHFLFNALNTIRYFVRTDAKAARRLLLDLSEVFQRALRSGEFVPLQDEISYVEAYLALEKARLDDRLQVEWAIRAEDRLDQPVPTLVLQPVVENAVVHGIAKMPEGGTVQITIEEADGDLLLRVEDDGPGIAPQRLAEILDQEMESGSIGLRNIDGRLLALYGEAYRLEIQSAVGSGTRVQIRIPIER